MDRDKQIKEYLDMIDLDTKMYECEYTKIRRKTTTLITDSKGDTLTHTTIEDIEFR